MMKSKTIKKEDIPEWELGDVEIKKLSFGDKLRLASMSQSMSVSQGQANFVNKEVSAYESVMHVFASGLKSVKDEANYEYLIKPGSELDTRLEFVSGDISEASGSYLVREIKSFNELSEELKKKS